MALTYTIAGLRAELDAFEVARKARDWEAAWNEYMDYVSVYSALAAKAKSGATEFDMPNPAQLKAGLEALQRAANISSNRPRFIFSRTGRRVPGSSRGRLCR